MKPLICIDTNEVWESANEASKKEDLPIGNLSKHLNKLRSCVQGRIFEYITREEFFLAIVDAKTGRRYLTQTK